MVDHNTVRGPLVNAKMKSKITIILFCFSLLIPFQNCAVYKSEGRKVFESNLADAENKGCYPYIDTNLAMQFLGIVDDSLVITKSYVSGESAVKCDFRAYGRLMDHVNCKVSKGNGELAILYKAGDMTVFEGHVSAWTATATPGFLGTTHGGYVTLDEDSLYTIRFLALDGSELKGVACAVRLAPADYSGISASVQSALSKISFEMAINNQD